MYAYVGSFTTAQRKARGDGIHVYRADPATGAWTHVQHIGDLVNPSYLALSRDQRFLYSVHGDEDYVTAFNIAEAEAKRRRRNDFSQDGQQRIARAQSLLRMASDSAATPQERQNAYDLAGKELDGLIVLPSTTQASIERGISGQIDG